jgi:hypothetical protein
MGRQVFLKPVEGATLRDPKTMTPIPPSGAYVMLDAHWRRAVTHGTAVIVEEGRVTAPPENASTSPPEAKVEESERRTTRRGGA